MGLSFKENCPDIRNTRVIDIIEELEEYGVSVEVYDPWVNHAEAKKEYGIDLLSRIEEKRYSGVIVAVAHRQYIQMSITDIKNFCLEQAVIYDVKNVFSYEDVDGCL